MTKIQCPLCKNSNTEIKKTDDYKMKIWFHCPICGYFAIMDYQVNKYNYHNYHQLNKLIYVIRKKSNENNYIELNYDELDQIANSVNYPETIEQKTDLLLEYIIEKEDGLNTGCAVGGDQYRDFALNRNMDLHGLIDFALECGFIITEMKFADGGAVCKLTKKGRQRLIEIDQKSKSDKNKVVVMKKNSNFSETMLKALKSAENEISKGNPDLAHDRMHTFLHDYLKQVCKKLSLNPKKQKPDIMELFSLIQKHFNQLNPNDITIKIFRALSKALDGINDIRNNKSLTHPNPVLGKPEAMFVINTIKTIYVYLEEKLK